ncbi:hypothetical protein QCA50_011365 [Cerrena zonata]|uniref:Uncharacterized protein n=1 Tax=Cerrena zonata TaxID=2478898 RepID=A0AAW0G767_9APHY
MDAVNNGIHYAPPLYTGPIRPTKTHSLHIAHGMCLPYVPYTVLLRFIDIQFQLLKLAEKCVIDQILRKCSPLRLLLATPPVGNLPLHHTIPIHVPRTGLLYLRPGISNLNGGI